ncbi:hypothetical protein H4R22_000953 [Coemansia sp. RSA 1290]|nr:hypothetical protein H4R22_000953 [Coemansia sp. RSA 1290]KAJ2649950.1 hypothetical protein IWW40_002804 [Coemansia sp. RSA 1250]
MVKLDTLPEDIIIRIFAQTYPLYDKSLVEWREALSLLAVSQNWRYAILPLAYQVLHITDLLCYSSTNPVLQLIRYDVEYGGIPAPTNIKLIESMNYKQNVRQLVFQACQANYLIAILLRVINILRVSESECPGVESLKEWSRIRFHENPVTPQLERESYSAAVTLGMLLVEQFPNVQRVSFVTRSACDMLLAFSTELLCQYADQLTRIQYSGPMVFPEPIAGWHNLTRVDLKLEDSPETQILKLDPCSLKYLSFMFYDVPFSWSYFIPDNSGVISFDSLECLKITRLKDDFPVPLGRQGISARFPKLKFLEVGNTSFNATEAKWMMSSPVQHLRLTGTAENLLVFCKQGLQNIHTLDIHFAHIPSNHVEQFFVSANTIFQLTSGIAKVSATFFTHTMDSLDRLSWPFITHAELLLTDGIAEPLMTLSRMPNLVYMKIRTNNFEANNIAETMSFLDSIKHKHSPLTESRLKKLNLCFYRYEPDQQFMSALDSIKWLIPSLNDLNLDEF